MGRKRYRPDGHGARCTVPDLAAVDAHVLYMTRARTTHPKKDIRSAADKGCRSQDQRAARVSGKGRDVPIKAWGTPSAHSQLQQPVDASVHASDAQGTQLLTNATGVSHGCGECSTKTIEVLASLLLMVVTVANSDTSSMPSPNDCQRSFPHCSPSVCQNAVV